MRAARATPARVAASRTARARDHGTRRQFGQNVDVNAFSRVQRLRPSAWAALEVTATTTVCAGALTRERATRDGVRGRRGTKTAATRATGERRDGSTRDDGATSPTTVQALIRRARGRRLARLGRLAGVLVASAMAAVTFASRAGATGKGLATLVPNASALEQVLPMLLTAMGLLVASAFFSMAETSITTLYPWKIRELADQEESSGGVFQILRKDVSRFLTTILIGTTFCDILATALVTEAALVVYGDNATTAVTVGLTIVTLLFTEIAPKSVAVQHAVATAKVIATPVYWLSLIVYPVGRIFQWIVNAGFSLFGVETSAEPFVSEEELKLVLAGATKSGEVASSEKNMIQNVLDLEETVVRDVMTPLVQVWGVSVNATLSECRQQWLVHKYSRMPVYDDRVDNIVGMIRANRIMQIAIERINDPERHKPLEEIIVSQVMVDDPYFVPESMSVSKLLRELMFRKTHMCVVVNEFGGVVGIATLEDCVEEIVGEIYDEEDNTKSDEKEEVRDEEPLITVVRPGEYLVDTSVPLWKLAEELSLEIPESPLYETVGGFVCDLFGSIPEQGATITRVYDFIEDEDASDDEESDDETDGLEIDGEHTQRMIILTVTEADTRMVKEIRVDVRRYRKGQDDDSDEESAWADSKPIVPRAL